jgi:hypothetical protein
VAALRLDLVVGPTQRINLIAFGVDNTGYAETPKLKLVRFEVRVVRGIKNECEKGRIGSMILVERASKVDEAILILCDSKFRWKSSKAWDQTVAVSIKKVAVIPKN